MTGRWHRLRLQVRVDEQDGAEIPQLIPLVDDSVLFLDLDTRADSEASGLGMDPDELLGRDSPLLPPELTTHPEKEPREATVWRCSCGEPGDASIGVHVYREGIGREDDTIVWDHWQMRFHRRFGRDLQAPPPLRFDTRAYYAEFIRAHTDRWWESTPRRAARELAGLLNARPEILGAWGCVLIFTRGNLLRGGHGQVQVLLRSATIRHALDLPCDPAADPAAEARRLANQLAHTDPATLPAKFHSTVP